MSDTKVSQYEYAVHPLANLFPEITGDEYRKLKEDIEKHGQQEPIIIDEADEVLLDGRTRLRILKELGKTPRIDRFTATPAYSESDLIWSRNVMRRHLTADQRAMLSQRWADGMKDAAKLRQKAHGGTAPGVSKNTSGENAISVTARKETAKKAGVTEHKIRQAETVATHAPELASQVERGEVSLKDAAGTATAAKNKSAPIRTARKPVMPPKPYQAARWLLRVLDAGEKNKYFSVNERDVWYGFPSKGRSKIQHAITWMENILRADKPLDHADTEHAQPTA